MISDLPSFSSNPPDLSCAVFFLDLARSSTAVSRSLMASLNMSTAMIALLLQIAAVVSGFHFDLDLDVNPRSTCKRVDLHPCHTAVEGQERPSRECCRRFQQIQDDECKCEAILKDMRLGDSKYLDRALRLPEECGLSPPRGRECERRRLSDHFLQVDVEENDSEMAEDDPARRREEIESLQPCYQAVEGHRQPSQECCDNLRRIPRERRCEAIRQDQRLGQERYREDARRLPEQCGLPRCERRIAYDF